MTRCKSKIIGFLLVLIFLVSAYTLVVQVVQEFNDRSLITQLSLFGPKDANWNETQFNLGESVSVCAWVSAGNAYSIAIYGVNGSVFSQDGWINGSEAVVQVPLAPRAFHANESYVVVFTASISVYPIPGAFVTDQRMTGFTVLAPATQLNLTCNYDGTRHCLSLAAALATSQGAPVANKTITFDVQLNTSSYVQDRGWLPLGSATTDANGLASYVTGCDLFSGIQYVRAEFAGDSDYSGSTNTTQFTVTPFTPVIQSVNVTSSATGTQYAVEVTDQNGYPLTGKTIVVQGQQSSDPAYGVTDREGTAFVWLNGSDSSSDPVQNVTVLGDQFTCQSELTCHSSGYVAPSSDRVIPLSPNALQASQSTSGLIVSMSPSHPCAVLPTLVTASYCGWILPGGLACFSFLLDGVRELSQVYVIGQGNDTYNVPLEWCSDVVGNHSITVIVSTVSVPDAVLAEGSVVVDPTYCPDNLQLNTPQAAYGNQIRFSLVFTEPYPYNQTSTQLFSSFNTAPGFSNQSGTYKIDWGIFNSSVTLSINASNGTSLWRQTVTTDKDGVASINDSIPMTRPNLTYDFAANTSRNSYFAPFDLTRVINYSDVGVSASASANEDLTLGCSVGEGNATDNQVYVGAQSLVEASAELFGMAVYDAPVNVTFAEFIPTCETWNKTGVNYGQTLTIPAGANFLHVACIYTDPCLDGAIASYKLYQNWNACCDEVVNINDVFPIAVNWLKTVANGADPLADINHDGVVNINDVFPIATNWLKTGSYLPSFGAVAVFSAGGNSSLDSTGCVVIPKQAQGGTSTVRFTLKNGKSVGAFVEFFCVVNQTSELNIHSLTDTSGEAGFSWTPSVTGDYLVEVKLPAHFNATVSQNEPTSVSTSVCTVEYVQVVKRPVALSLTPLDPSVYGGPEYSMDIKACADAAVAVTNPPTCPVDYYNENFGTENETCVCVEGDPWLFNGAALPSCLPVGWTFLNFNLYSFMKNAYIDSANLTLYVLQDNYGAEQADAIRSYGVYAVLQPWNEYTICGSNAPQTASTPMATATVNLSQSLTEVTWDLTSALQGTSVSVLSSYLCGFVIKDENNSPAVENPSIDFYSRESGQPAVLGVSFTIPSYFVLNATDALGKPAKQVPYDYYVNGTYAGSSCTDDSGQGLVDVSVPLDGSALGVYNVTAFTYETDWYLPAVGSWTYDNRWSSNLTCQQGITVNATVNGKLTLGFQLFAQELCGITLANEPVSFYVPGGEPSSGSNSTNANGQVSFSWTPTQAKTYVITACFGGTGVFAPCNVSICVTAQVVPVGVGLSVSNSEFAPGTTLTLTANLTNLKTGGVMPNFLVQFCYNNSADKSGVLYTTSTGSNGVATYGPWQYPNNGTAYALYAQAGTTNGNQPQNMASSPVQLTVGLNTTLLLSVSRENSSDTHTFMARLVDNAGNPVVGRILTLELNDTQHEYSATTNNLGNATWTETLSPQANDSATTYNIVVSFAGDTRIKSATAYLASPNGTQCAICTTIQYSDYKPSANSTSILVWPQTTTGATTLESPEQMQAYAKSKGWFSVYNEFSWWFPWYRMHVVVNLAGTTINVGFNPLLLGGETCTWNGVNLFADMTGEVLQDIAIDITTIFATYIVAKVAGIWNIALGIVAEFVKFGMQTLLLVEQSQGPSLLASAFCSFLIGLLAIVKVDLAEQILNTLYKMLAASAIEALDPLFAVLCGMVATSKIIFRGVVDYLEIAFDFITGGFAIMKFYGWL